MAPKFIAGDFRFGTAEPVPEHFETSAAEEIPDPSKIWLEHVDYEDDDRIVRYPLAVDIDDLPSANVLRAARLRHTKDVYGGNSPDIQTIEEVIIHLPESVPETPLDVTTRNLNRLFTNMEESTAFLQQPATETSPEPGGRVVLTFKCPDGVELEVFRTDGEAQRAENMYNNGERIGNLSEPVIFDVNDPLRVQDIQIQITNNKTQVVLTSRGNAYRELVIYGPPTDFKIRPVLSENATVAS